MYYLTIQGEVNIACDFILTFKWSIIVQFVLDYHVDLSFSMFSLNQNIATLYETLMNSRFPLYKDKILIQKWYWFHKMVSIIERCRLFLLAIKRFFYETITVIPSLLINSVRYIEVSAIKHIRYREVPLYSAWNAYTKSYSIVVMKRSLNQY